MPVLSHHGVFPSLHPSVFLADGAFVIGDVRVGEKASIWYNAILRGDINSITIGARTNIQDASVLHVTHDLGVVIGDDVTVGHQAILHGCSIDDCALIGMGALVLDNAKVGTCAMVAAGAVVLEGFVVPAATLAAGVPARIIRKLTDEELRRLRESAEHYVAYAQSSMKGKGWTEKA